MELPNTRRFFIAPATLRGNELLLADQALAHQLARVLRLGPGDRVLLLDGLGSACELELMALTRAEVAGRVLWRGPAGGEPPVELVVYLALMRAERFEWAIQKCVELGARRVVPVQFARSLPADRADDHKLERWRRIMREAAEQACRGLLPDLAPPLTFAAACEQASQSTLALILWEGEAPHLRTLLRPQPSALVPHPSSLSTLPDALSTQHSALSTLPSTLALLSGPVGGITPAELTAARQHGIMPASLGPRILRAETAPIAALAAILYELEA